MSLRRTMTDEQLRKVAEALVGRCDKDIDDICEEEGYPGFDAWTIYDCFEFDELVFRCARCEWWVGGDEHGSEESEASEGNFVCSECG